MRRSLMTLSFALAVAATSSSEAAQYSSYIALDDTNGVYQTPGFNTALGTLTSVSVVGSWFGYRYNDYCRYDCEGVHNTTTPLITDLILESGHDEIVLHGSGIFTSIQNPMQPLYTSARADLQTTLTLPGQLALLSTPSFSIYTPTFFDGPFMASADLTFNYIPSTVPEPSTWIMMVLGIGTIGATVRLNKKAGNLVRRRKAFAV